MREKLADGPREDRALAYLMFACLLIFVAQWPRLARQAELDDIALQPLIGGALLGWLFVAPLALYLIAAVIRLIAGVFGGRGSGYSARLALFWSLLATSPLWLLYGLTAGLIGDGPALTLVGILTLVGFLAIWVSCLIEAEWIAPVETAGNHT